MTFSFGTDYLYSYNLFCIVLKETFIFVIDYYQFWYKVAEWVNIRLDR